MSSKMCQSSLSTFSYIVMVDAGFLGWVIKLKVSKRYFVFKHSTNRFYCKVRITTVAVDNRCD